MLASAHLRTERPVWFTASPVIASAAAQASSQPSAQSSVSTCPVLR
jgi:hypothetical protein